MTKKIKTWQERCPDTSLMDRDNRSYECQTAMMAEIDELRLRIAAMEMETELPTRPAEPMAWPELSADAMTALMRFSETCEDGQGYDVPKPMMRALAAIGVVQHTSAGIYAITVFGEAVVEKAGQRAQAFMAREKESLLDAPSSS